MEPIIQEHDPTNPPAIPSGRPAGTLSDPRATRRTVSDTESSRASRGWWDRNADDYQREHGAFLGDDRFVWGPEGLDEAEAGLLGPAAALAGRSVLEIGAGAAQCSRWLAAQGARPVALDVSFRQLQHALRIGGGPPSGAGVRDASSVTEAGCGAGAGASDAGEGELLAGGGRGRDGARGANGRWAADGARGFEGAHGRTGGAGHGGPHEPGVVRLVQADAGALPFADGSFDLACSAYGALPFVAEPVRVLREVRRVLRPGGRFAFSVTHPIRWAFEDEPGPEGLSVSASYFDRTPYVEEYEEHEGYEEHDGYEEFEEYGDGDGRGGGARVAYVEHHRTLGDRVRDVVAAGLRLVDLVEPEWPSWNRQVWGGWSPLRGSLIPGTAIFVCEVEA